MYTMAATAMSTVSMSIVGAYMTMLEPKYVVAALVLNMFSTFIVLSLINPYRVDASEENIQMSNLHEGQSFFEMLRIHSGRFQSCHYRCRDADRLYRPDRCTERSVCYRDWLVWLQHLLPRASRVTSSIRLHG